jgi:hypothetical protein
MHEPGSNKMQFLRWIKRSHARRKIINILNARIKAQRKVLDSNSEHIIGLNPEYRSYIDLLIEHLALQEQVRRIKRGEDPIIVLLDS